MSQLRRDAIVGRWVIVADKEQSLGPDAYEKEDHSPRQEAVCQFCAGKENQTPPETDVIRGKGSQPNGPGWSARVVSNKFPALRIEGELTKHGEGIYDVSNGVGAHEVLIETPVHRRNLADYSLEDVVNVIKLYQNRSVSLARDKRFRYIMIFKNYGESAGASVEHAHSQIIALPMVPKHVVEELDGAREYYRRHGRCIFCDIIQQEYEEKERIITENETFLAFCPFVPRYPFESWIIPKEHNSEFCTLNDQQRVDLASILKELTTRLKNTLSDPAYNYYLHVAPVNYGEGESFHWHVEIVPQIAREAGFEWGSGFYVVRTEPAVAAEVLRSASV